MSGLAEAPRPVDPVLDRLKRLHPKIIDLSLDRVHALLAALGHPERALAPVIHVAGTNGKGSTVAFLRAMLEASGRRVHVYTSPHLVRFNERIRLGGVGPIGDEALLAALETCEEANEGRPITYFEITTAAMFLAFARHPADAVLLETGLGGRLDATNVIERPAATAITRISYDHMGFLGDSLTAIAGEKAGIFRPGVAAVIAPQPAAEAAAALEARARDVGAPLWRGGVEWQVTAAAGDTGDGFRYRSAINSFDLPAPGLKGAHQIVNAGVAIACLERVADLLPIDPAAMRRGVEAVEWPARLQRLTRGPLVERLPAGWELWLDGGHNDSAGEVLAAQAAAWARVEPERRLDLVFGMLATKVPDDFLRPLAPFVCAMRTVDIPGEEASLTAAEAAMAARGAEITDAEPAADPAAALDALIARAQSAEPGRPRRVLICGSLYLAGTILAGNG